MIKVHFKGEGIADFDLDKPRITIGRDASNDIVLEPSGVSGFHAEIQTDQGKSYIVDLGSQNGTYINGKKVVGKQPISPWDIIRIDQIEMEVVDTEGRRPTTVSAAVPEAAVASAAAEKKSKQVDPDKTTVRQAIGDWLLLGQSGAMAGKPFPVSKKMIVGRDADCDIVLNSNEISRRHAELQVESGKLTVRDLASANGVFVNGNKIQACDLKAGDEVRFDELIFKVQRMGDDPEKTSIRKAVSASPNATQIMPSSRPKLIGISSGISGREYKVPGHKATIGREADNDIVFAEATVSAQHATIYSESGIWKLEDKGSSNGTFVNGSKISRTVNLKDGDQLRFGKMEVRFDDGSAEGAGTRLMSSLADDAATKTSVHATRKGMPAWLYGVVGFVVVGLVFGYFLFGKQLGIGGEKQPTGPLQANVTWSQSLPNSRQYPTTPVLADVNGDGVLDVVMADAGGHLLVLDGQKGKQVVDMDIADRIIAPPVAGDLNGDGIDDIVVATDSGDVYAINGSGKVLWRSPSNLGAGAIINRPVLADVNGDGVKDVIVPTENKGLVALDGKRGWELWNSGGTTDGKVVGSPIVKDINGDGNLDFVSLTDTGQLTALSVKDGQAWKLWSVSIGAPVLYASPAYIDTGKGGLIVVATKGGGIVAVKAKSGRMAWQSKVPGDYFASPVTADANNDGVPDVIAVSTDGDVHVLNGLTGDEIWSTSIGAGVRATPALFDFNGDGMADILLLDTNGDLHVLDMARGRDILKMKVPGADGFVASPVLGDVTDNGLLEVVTAAQDGEISALSFNRTVSKGTAPWPSFLGNDRHGL